MWSFAIDTDKGLAVGTFELGQDMLMMSWERNAVFILAGNLVEVVYLWRHVQPIFALYLFSFDDIQGTSRSNRAEHLNLPFIEREYIGQRNQPLVELWIIGMIDTVGAAAVETHDTSYLINLPPDAPDLSSYADMIDNDAVINRFYSYFVFRFLTARHRRLFYVVLRRLAQNLVLSGKVGPEQAGKHSDFGDAGEISVYGLLIPGCKGRRVKEGGGSRMLTVPWKRMIELCPFGYSGKMIA